MQHAQSLRFDHCYCSFIDCARTNTSLSDARRANPPAGDELQIFFPSPGEGGDVVCFGKTQDQGEVAIIVQVKLCQDPAVPRNKAVDAVASTRPEKLKLEQLHPSIRILCMWPSSATLDSLLGTMTRAAKQLNEDYFILMDEEGMEQCLWSDPLTAMSLRRFKTGSVPAKAHIPAKRTLEQANE